MIDHVLGRPSVTFRKTQVFAVVGFWAIYLWRGHKHGPPILRKLSRRFSTRLTSWQTTVLLLLYLYITRNFGKLVGLECPEPLANLYTRSYFRATWVTTALDAGFWSAMHMRPKWCRDLGGIVFTVYYLICAEQADEKVRKVRAGLTLQHLRVSWNKPTTPYIRLVTDLLRPKLGKHKYPPRELRIPRPAQSSYSEPIHAWLYYDGPLSGLRKHDKIVLDIPGGGFVAMNPRCHEDKLLGWAGRTGLPVLALDYKKAPEHPYPYALNECYDAYHTLVASRGRCIGLSGEYVPKIVISGDSAGGNLAVGMTLMLLQAGTTDTRRWLGESSLPLPESLVLMYPALDMNIGNWMTDEQMALIKDRRSRGVNRGVIRRKSDDYRKLTPDTPHGSDDEDEDASGSPKKKPSQQVGMSPDMPNTSAAHTIDAVALSLSESKPTPLKTRLAMSSMISYFNDRVLTPEMMRAMIILYVGPHSRPDFSTDFLLSPLLAPENLLVDFPKTYFLTGERDPLVDDTVIFAGRLRQAKAARWAERKELGLVPSKERFDESAWVTVTLVPGISHGFLQFVSVFPEGWRYIFRCARWMQEAFREADERDLRERIARTVAGKAGKHPAAEDNNADVFSDTSDDEDDDDGETPRAAAQANGTPAPPRHHRRQRTASSGDDDRPLEMSAIRASPPTGAGAASASSASAQARRGRRRTNTATRASAANAGSAVTVVHAARPLDGAASAVAAANGVPAAGGSLESSPERSRKVGGAERRAQRERLHALASSDDLLGRRMKGLTGGLMGVVGEVQTP